MMYVPDSISRDQGTGHPDRDRRLSDWRLSNPMTFSGGGTLPNLLSSSARAV